MDIGTWWGVLPRPVFFPLFHALLLLMRLPGSAYQLVAPLSRPWPTYSIPKDSFTLGRSLPRNG
jgi:hypothetical protein